MSSEDLRHFAVIADGRVLKAEHGCPVGPAFLGMKAWAADAEEAAHMARLISPEMSFDVTGEVQVYATEATEPAADRPFGYDIKLTGYQEQA